jgi:hypothetical protein
VRKNESERKGTSTVALLSFYQVRYRYHAGGQDDMKPGQEGRGEGLGVGEGEGWGRERLWGRGRRMTEHGEKAE